jgi:biopolymer transport protein ExbB
VGDPSRVADGISEALITTASGLIIAIPVIVAHRYLAVRAGASMRRLEVHTHALGHALLRAGSETDPAGPSPVAAQDATSPSA